MHKKQVSASQNWHSWNAPGVLHWIVYALDSSVDACEPAHTSQVSAFWHSDHVAFGVFWSWKCPQHSASACPLVGGRWQSLRPRETTSPDRYWSVAAFAVKAGRSGRCGSVASRQIQFSNERVRKWECTPHGTSNATCPSALFWRYVYNYSVLFTFYPSEKRLVTQFGVTDPDPKNPGVSYERTFRGDSILSLGMLPGSKEMKMGRLGPTTTVLVNRFNSYNHSASLARHQL